MLLGRNSGMRSGRPQDTSKRFKVDPGFVELDEGRGARVCVAIVRRGSSERPRRRRPIRRGH